MRWEPDGWWASAPAWSKAATTWWLRPLLVVVCLVLAGNAPAVASGTVVKCLDAGGQIIFTSTGCPDGTRLAATYEAEPDAVLTPAARRGRTRNEATPTAAPRPRARSAPRTAGPRSGSKRDPARARCQAARDKRDRTLERVGLKRTFDLLRRLDDEVRAACG